MPEEPSTTNSSDQAPRPIAWMALEEGTPVRSSDGEEIGHVATIVADEGKDIFSGLSVRSGLLGSPVFVPADLVDEITADAVSLTITAAESAELEAAP
ncbi:MAG: PRC-barrel domain-containing protein [Actinomycetota bacterium]|nr:PRC-barrel domain-containing protein [Actinomycetota bacterium]